MIGSPSRLSLLIGCLSPLSPLVPVMIDIFGWVMLGPIILTSAWHRPQYDTSGRRHHQDQTRVIQKMSEKNWKCLPNWTVLHFTYLKLKHNTFPFYILAVDASKNNDHAESGSNNEMRIWPPVKLFLDLKYFTTFSPPPSKILISVSPGGVAKIFL